MSIKQHRIKWIGAVVDSLFTCLPFLSIWNFVAIAIVLYTDILPYLIKWLPWIKLPYFLLILGFIALVLMLVVYKFVLKSLWSFRKEQMTLGQDKTARRIKKIMEHLGIEDEDES